MFVICFLPQMSWNGSEQLEKAMEEVLDDDDEVKVEKSSVEKMEKHSDPESRAIDPRPAGILTYQSVSCSFIHPTMHQNWNTSYIVLGA